MSIVEGIYRIMSARVYKGAGRRQDPCDRCGQVRSVQYVYAYSLSLCRTCQRKEITEHRQRVGDLCQHPGGCPNGWELLYTLPNGERMKACTAHGMRLRHMGDWGRSGIDGYGQITHYDTAHSWLIGNRYGSASLYTCHASHCTRKAQGWAHDHLTCQHMATQYTGKNRGMTFCTERYGSCYAPMCAKHHRALDDDRLCLTTTWKPERLEAAA